MPGMRRPQSLLRGKPYRPFEDVLRDAATGAGIEGEKTDELLARWANLHRGPTCPACGTPECHTRFHRHELLGAPWRVAARAPVSSNLVMTAAARGAYKPRSSPYRAALDALDLAPKARAVRRGVGTRLGARRARELDVYWANADACRTGPTAGRSGGRGPAGPHPSAGGLAIRSAATPSCCARTVSLRSAHRPRMARWGRK